MDRMYELDILPPAQAELEEIARIHLALSGAKYARNITDEIYAAMNQLTMFPLSGTPVHDEQLRTAGYRYTMAEKYLIFYRPLGNTIVIYHIAHGSTDYPKLLKTMYF